MPETTKVLDPANTGITRVDTGSVTLGANAPQAAALRAGDHLVAAKDGKLLVRKVTRVNRTGGSVTLATEQARLDEALPSGVIEIDAGQGLESSPEAMALTFAVTPRLVVEGELDLLIGSAKRRFDEEFEGWRWDLWRLDRPRPLPSPVDPLPQGLPRTLHLPGEDDPEFSDLSDALSTPWSIAGCPDRALPSDARRTAMRTVAWGAGDGGFTSQVAVYPDEDAARQAMEQIRAAAPPCRVTHRLPLTGVPLGHEGSRFATFTEYEPPYDIVEGAGSLERSAFVRQSNAIILVVSHSDLMTVDSLSADMSGLLTTAAGILDQLCSVGFRC